VFPKLTECSLKLTECSLKLTECSLKLTECSLKLTECSTPSGWCGPHGTPAPANSPRIFHLSTFPQVSRSIPSQISRSFPGAFPQPSLNLPEICPEHSLNIPSTFPQHALNIPSTFPQHSFNNLSTFWPKFRRLNSTRQTVSLPCTNICPFFRWFRV
jgi:hypothetical protein